jgi:hypothetical protein
VPKPKRVCAIFEDFLQSPENSISEKIELKEESQEEGSQSDLTCLV